MADDMVVDCLFERKSRFNFYHGKSCAGKRRNVSVDKNDARTQNKIPSYYDINNNHHTKTDTISILYRRNEKRIRHKTRREYKILHRTDNEIIFIIRSFINKKYIRKMKNYSTSDLKTKCFKINYRKQIHRSKTESLGKCQYTKKYTNNNCSRTYSKRQCLNPFMNSLIQANIYRCQIGGKEESCCCSCNSDAMFEVMKSLYDCYKKKDCNNCDCVLCGHLPVREILKTGEERKSVAVGVGEGRVKEKTVKVKAEKGKTEAAIGKKSSAAKEKILQELAKAGQPMPEGKTPSEKKMIQRIKTVMGIPLEPAKISSTHLRKAKAEGLLTPLEGKTHNEKEKILRGLAKAGLPLPEGKTASEKKLIQTIKDTTPVPAAVKIPSEKLKKLKAAGLLTPLEGKKPEHQEKIIKGLAQEGLPLPEGKTASQRKIIAKVRKEVGLPPEPRTPSEKNIMANSYAAGLITPLEGKTASQKEIVLTKLAKAGIPLPEGRSVSEKVLIAKIKAVTQKFPAAARIPSEKLGKAKAEGLLTPLEGKSPQQQEKILKRLAKAGLPLPEGKTTTERKLIDKVRKDMGLPPQPKTPSEKVRMAKSHTVGIIQPLEGKSASEKEKLLTKMAEAGVALPEGRTASEKAIIAKVKATTRQVPSMAIIPSEKLRFAKAEGLLTPLEGKSPQQQQRILKGLAIAGLPLPEGKTISERKLIDKVRKDMGLPPQPKTPSEKVRMAKSHAAGIIQPLEGKSASEKEKILTKMAEAGVTMPEGRTASEKSLIAKVKATAPQKSSLASISSEKFREAKPTGKARREKLSRSRLALSPEKREKLDKKTAKVVKEGKGPAHECICDLLTPESQKSKAAPLGSVSTEKLVGLPSVVPGARIPSEKLRKAKAAGLLTPLEGKSSKQKEKILKGLAQAGIPLPEAKTASERKLIDKVRKDVGLPPEPKTSYEKVKMAKSYAAGLITPLEGKNAAQKETILKKMTEAGVELPEGRTASEKALIAKVKATSPRTPSATRIASERLRKAKAEGLLTPLEGKTPEQSEKILKGLAKAGIPLPEGKTTSQRKIIDKVRKDMGLPPQPKTPSEKVRMARSHAAGIIQPLEGKSASEKEKILTKMAEAGVVLPEGRNASEKALIAKVKATTRQVPSMAIIPSEKLRFTKAEGLLTPLEGKSPQEQENILKGLAKAGLPLPEGKTTSKRKLIDKVRKDMGLPPKPRTPSEKVRMAKSHAAGIIQPLEGKSASEKEKILTKMAEAGVVLPEGRTASEKALIAKVKAKTPQTPSLVKIPSEKLRKAKMEGLLTPLDGKSPQQQQRILKGLAIAGLPLPEGKTTSERKLIDKVRKDMGLPPEPKTPSEKVRMMKSHAAGIIQPLEGKSASEKEKILTKMAEAGVVLPEGRNASEKALIAKVKAKIFHTPSEQLRKAKFEGLSTPLEGKSPEQRVKILKSLAMNGIPLPKGQTISEKKLIEKVRAEVGLPPEPKTVTEKKRYNKARTAGLILPLEGKTVEQKEKILRGLAELRLQLPEGRTPSEKALINKIKAQVKPPAEADFYHPALSAKPGRAALSSYKREKLDKKTAKIVQEGKGPSDECICDLLTEASDREMIFSLDAVPSDKLRKAKAAGLLTPLEGKTAEEQERILKGLAKAGIPLPKGKTSLEKARLHKIKTEMAPEAGTASEKEVIKKAQTAGLFTPLAGKTTAQKEKIVKGLIEAGLPVPEGKTLSDKEMIRKVRTLAGLSPEPTPSEIKGKIRTKSKAIGGKSPGARTKGVGVSVKGPSLFKAGITEEMEDVVKTTTCDRGCGCNKKKIRFKHSYVKIRVTSPDISSLCPCPDECIPGVQGGVFVDNEGIKVTVGKVTGTPSYTQNPESYKTHTSAYSLNFVQSFTSLYSATVSSNHGHDFGDIIIDDISDVYKLLDYYKSDGNIGTPVHNISSLGNVKENDDYSDSIDYDSRPNDYSELNIKASKEQNFPNDSKIFETSSKSWYSLPSKIGLDSFLTDINTECSSYDSIVLLRTESSLSFSSWSTNNDHVTISVLSFVDSVSTTSDRNEQECLRYDNNIISSEESEHFQDKIDYSAAENKIRKNNTLKETTENHYKSTSIKYQYHKDSDEVICFTYSEHETKNEEKKVPLLVLNQMIDCNDNITKVVTEILSQKPLSQMSDSSSVFVLVSSDEGDSTSINSGAGGVLLMQDSNSNKEIFNEYPCKYSIVRTTGDSTTCLRLKRNTVLLSHYDFEKTTGDRSYIEKSVESNESICEETRKVLEALGQLKRTCGNKHATKFGYKAPERSSMPPNMFNLKHVRYKDPARHRRRLHVPNKDTIKVVEDRNCVCPQIGKKSEKQNCDCQTACCDPPPESDDDAHYSNSDLNKILRRRMIQMKSDLTQTTTGFKISNVPKAVEVDMNFEEALEYYKQKEIQERKELTQKCDGCGQFMCPGLGPPGFPLIPSCQGEVVITDLPERGYHQACVCDSKEAFEQATYSPPKNTVICECPSQLPTPGVPSDVNVPRAGKGGGISLTICGKGSVSPGLKGICCFDLTENYYGSKMIQSKLNSASSTSTTYLVYVS